MATLRRASFLVAIMCFGASGFVGCGVSLPDESPPDSTGAKASLQLNDDGCGVVVIGGHQLVSPFSSNDYNSKINGLCTDPFMRWTITSGACSIQGPDTGATVTIASGGVGTCVIQHMLACSSCQGARVLTYLQISVSDHICSTQP